MWNLLSQHILGLYMEVLRTPIRLPNMRQNYYTSYLTIEHEAAQSTFLVLTF